MRKKLLAILLSASMVVCLMPTMAFATEDPATPEVATPEVATPEVENVVEEPKEEIQEETPAVTEEEEFAEDVEEEFVEEEVEEAEEEVKEEAPAENATLSETPAESAEEAELQVEQEVTGAWSGYQFKITTETIGAIAAAFIEESDVNADGEVDEADLAIIEAANKKIKVENGIVDVTDAVNYIFETGTACMVEAGYKYGEGGKGSQLSTAVFNKIVTTVDVDKASSKDTTFNYGIDSYLNLETNIIGNPPNETATNTVNRSKEIASGDEMSSFEEGVELVKNSVILKAGETSVNDNLVIRFDQQKKAEPVGFSFNMTAGYVIKEISNDGNYSVPDTLWVATRDNDFQEFINAATTNTVGYALKLASFNNSEELDAFLAELNGYIKAGGTEALKYYTDTFTGSTISTTFSHTALPVEDVEDVEDVDDEEETVKSTKTGVQTGDSNELGLWLAFGMLASVAAAGYALKRREN